MKLGLYQKIDEVRIEFWFEKYQHHVNLYQRSDEGTLRCVHVEDYDRTRGLEGCVGVGISHHLERKWKEEDQGPTEAMKAQVTDPFPGITIAKNDNHVVKVDYVARNMKSGRQIKGTTYSVQTVYWLSG